MIKKDGKIYWGDFGRSVMFLIPKKRGEGFLRQPVAHHSNDLSRFITNLGYDCDGLDGYLNVCTGSTYGKENEVKELVNEIAGFYDKEAVEVGGTAILDYCLRH